jgi:error-prone DNA polymerase
MDARKAGGPFKSPEELMRRARLRPSAMLTLARADAFDSLKFSRRETLWHVAGLEADELPLFRPEDATERTGNIHNAKSFNRNDPGDLQSRFRNDDDIQLPPLKEEEAVAEDYAVFGLSLRNHPMAFMREELREKGMVTAADLKTLATGKFVKIAGLVLFRQRPGTAKGTIFITMEDETGAANLIVWPKVAETYRRAVFGAKVILCEGILQKESNVIHIVSRRLTDGTAMLRRFQPEASAFGSRFGRGDEVAHTSEGDARASRVHSNWTDTLKSRDFR